MLAIGGLGTLQDVALADWARKPSAFGVHLEPVTAIGHSKVMKALFEVEQKYRHVGASLLDTFFSRKVRVDEERWKASAAVAQSYDEEQSQQQGQTAGGGRDGENVAVAAKKQDDEQR
jgi:hypothetical protein